MYVDINFLNDVPSLETYLFFKCQTLFKPDCFVEETSTLAVATCASSLNT